MPDPTEYKLMLFESLQYTMFSIQSNVNPNRKVKYFWSMHYTLHWALAKYDSFPNAIILNKMFSSVVYVHCSVVLI